VVVGAVVQIEHINFDKNTIQILVEDTDIAIRIEEAKVIEVIKVEE
jgi:Fe2+ transport system protein FeoA